MTSNRTTNDRLGDLERDAKVFHNQLAKLSAEIDSIRQEHNASVTPQQTANQEHNATERQAPLKPEIPPAPANSNQPKKPWYRTLQGWKTLLECIAVPFAILYAVVTCLQWGIMHDSFEAANKPSIGVESIALRHVGRDKDGKQIVSEVRTPDTDSLQVTIQVANFGLAVGENYSSYTRGFLNGREQPDRDPSPPAAETMFPGKKRLFTGITNGPSYVAVMNGTEILELHISTRYDGPKHHYEHCETARYDRRYNAFTMMGTCVPEFKK